MNWPVFIQAAFFMIGSNILFNVFSALYRYESRDPIQLNKYGPQAIKFGNVTVFILALLCFIIAGAVR